MKRALWLLPLCLLLMGQDYNVPFRPRAAGGGDVCDGATDYTTVATHCYIRVDGTWAVGGDPDDECGSVAMAASTALTEADDLILDTGLPAGTDSGQYLLRVDPATENLRIANDSSLFTITTDFSVCAWLDPTSNSTDDYFQWDVGLGVGMYGNSNAGAGDDIGVFFSGLATNLVSGDLDLCRNGTWCYACMVFDDNGTTDTVRIIVNGTDRATSATFTGSPASGTNTGYGPQTNDHAADIHEMAVFNTAIAATTACQIMSCGLNGNSTTGATRRSTYGACTLP